MGEQTDAAKRAAARKAKILARGNTGLDRLAQTARGDEAGKLYNHGETSKSCPCDITDNKVDHPHHQSKSRRNPNPNHHGLLHLRRIPTRAISPEAKVEINKQWRTN
jgi:hypothetical protein